MISFRAILGSTFVLLAIAALGAMALWSAGHVSADSHEEHEGMAMHDEADEDEVASPEMSMSGEADDEPMEGEGGSGSHEMAMSGSSPETDTGHTMTAMTHGGQDNWRDTLNKIAYPVTALLALATAGVCFLLIRATGLVDKFALITFGLALFVVQSLVGVAFYVSDGEAVSMPTLMLTMAGLNSIAMLAIGTAFLRWYRMIGV